MMGRFFKQKNNTVQRIELVQQKTNNYFSFNGKMFESDIIRACIRPDAKAVGKAVVKHVREYNGNVDINPEPYIRFLLMQPNPWMTMQQMIEKVVTTYELNNNAFVLINRDENGYPYELYPINAYNVEAIFDKSGFLYYKFMMKNSKYYTFNALNIIHLKSDVFDDDIFGTSPIKALKPVMDVVSTTDQGIVNAIKNSAVIRWLLKFNTTLKPKDVKENTDEFVKNYLKITEENDSIGVAAVDNKMDAHQIDPKDYVPNATQMKQSTLRIYSYFNTNEKIVTSSYNEDEWNTYYGSKIEPILIQLSDLFTNKIFSRKEISFGNRIYFESSNIQYASLSTKLQFVALVDRGAMTPNAWCALFGLPPVEGGDKPVRRLDTRPVVEEPITEGGDE